MLASDGEGRVLGPAPQHTAAGKESLDLRAGPSEVENHETRDPAVAVAVADGNGHQVTIWVRQHPLKLSEGVPPRREVELVCALAQLRRAREGCVINRRDQHHLFQRL